MSTRRPWLDRAVELVEAHLDGLATRPVRAEAPYPTVRDGFRRALPDEGLAPLEAVEALAAAARPGLVASAGPRYFGFVIGGSLRSALAADWLTAAWDQNAASAATSPAAGAVEEIVAAWVLDLLALPSTSSVGFVTGCQMASFVGLAAARHDVLGRIGWNVERDGLIGAPPLNVIVGEEAHATIFSALRMVGLGSGRARRVAVDSQGRMRADELRRVLAACSGPTIVCAQAGNVNTGAFDPLDEICESAHERGAWVHVDGAFGLWARAAPAKSALARGAEKADSWATDGHKWLNVPYDSGLAIVRDPDAHRASLVKQAAYLTPAAGGARDNHDFTPESSRRARAFALYAALLEMGRQGVAEIVESRCVLAGRLADRLRAASGSGVRVLNDVVLNQVLVGFTPPPGATAESWTRTVIARLQQDGTCWASPTHWQGQDAMRLSVSNWSTSAEDIDRSADAILKAAQSDG